MGKKSNPQIQNDQMELISTRGNGQKSIVAVHESDAPEISVIIPAYNLENEIGRCLKSVLAQQIDQMEIIVVNDCSTDRTEEVVRELMEKNEQIRLISLPENKGVAAARNAALDVARGEFIHFCDGDDAVPEGAYEELLHVARTKRADLVTGNYSRMYPSEGGVIRPFSHYSAPTGKERCFEAGNTMLWNKLYRREVIEKNHIRYDEDLKYYEDFLFFHRVLKESRIIGYTDSNVYIYTEPVTRPVDCTIRYANIDCALGLNKAWRSLALLDIEEQDVALWLKAYRWNLSWFFTYSWKMIQDVSVRKEAFHILRNLVVWLEAESVFGRWNDAERNGVFVDLFCVDYPTFCTISFEDYMIQLALVENLRPRQPELKEKADTKRTAEQEDLLVSGIEKQLSEVEKVYGTPLTNKRVWRDNYWNLLDSIMDDWRSIANSENKERLYQRIQKTVGQLYKESGICSIPNPDVLWREKQVFCMDFATFQMVNYSQYQMICARRLLPTVECVNSVTSVSERVFVQSDPALAFLTACRNGRVGMRTILRAVKEWLGFKFRRRR